MASRAQSKVTTDHNQIRSWAEERGAEPACVRGTGGQGDIGMLRLEFPGAPGARDESLEPISWDDWFNKFDERGLAFLFQEQTARGEQSNFNKLVSRETASAHEEAETKGTRRSRRGRGAGKRLVAAAAVRLRSAARSRRKAAKSSTRKSASRKRSSGTRAASSRTKATKAASGKRSAGRKSRTLATASSKRSSARKTASTKSARTRSISTARGSARSSRTASARGRENSRSQRRAA